MTAPADAAPKVALLLTRPRAASQRTAEILQACQGYDPICISPLMDIQPTGRHPDMRNISAVVFSSANAVAQIKGQPLPAWCVGDGTAAAARARGWHAISAAGDARALRQRIIRDAPAGRLVYLRGEKSRGDLGKHLQAAGIAVQEHIVYRQRLCGLNRQALALLSREQAVLVPLYSPETARQFADQLLQHGPSQAHITCVAISPAVAAKLAYLPRVRCLCADAPSGAAMLTALRHAQSTMTP
ncbi:MAG: uroporphyrinogen-III synthase [Rhodobacteraceae bacterium]|nr:uroporphyrinogen-III synthase [Paracoccaceae bacterium]